MPIVSPADGAIRPKVIHRNLGSAPIRMKKGLAESGEAASLDSWFGSSDLKHGKPAGSNRRALPFLGSVNFASSHISRFSSLLAVGAPEMLAAH